MIDVDTLYDCFDDVLVPVIRKFQVDPLVSNLGKYIPSFAKVVTVTVSEVNEYNMQSLACIIQHNVVY